MRRLLPPILAAACLLSVPASADPSVPAKGLLDSTRSAARAHAPGFAWLGLFAEGRTFTVVRDGAGLDLQGGAYLQILRNVALRGSYRLFDYDGTEGDSSWETDHHGVLVGLSFSF